MDCLGRCLTDMTDGMARTWLVCRAKRQLWNQSRRWGAESMVEAAEETYT